MLYFEPRASDSWDPTLDHAIGQIPRLYDCNPSGIPTTWACDRMSYNDGYCDKDCGAIDIDCPEYFSE